MSKYFVVTPVKHDGRRYFRGDELSIAQEEQAQALINSGALSTEPVEDEAPDQGENRAQSPEEKEAARAEKAQRPQETEDAQEEQAQAGTAVHVPMDEMTVAQLRDVAREYELPVSGTREELMQRIAEAKGEQ